MTEAVVELRAATRTYLATGNRVTGISGADVAILPGEIVGISGPSGSGKSTLLRLVAGIERPMTGQVLYHGAPAWSGRSRQRRARYPRPGYVMPVFQDPLASLDPRWPIWRTITEPVRTGSREDHRRLARQLLDRSGMDHVDETGRPSALSGGQCQRVAILRAVAAGPALIVADEPTAQQDVITASAMTSMLLEVIGTTTAAVIVSHNIGWLRTIAGRILVAEDGRLRPE